MVVRSPMLLNSPVEGTESYLELGSLVCVSLRGSSLGGRSATPLLQIC